MNILEGYCAEFGEIQYNNTFIDYSKIDKEHNKQNAENYLDKALKEKNYKLKKIYFERAASEFFIWIKTEPDNIYPIIQLARIYDLTNQDSYSKAYFFQALMIDKYNIDANYYLGDFYSYRREYKKALYYYTIAFDNGFKENFDILFKMGTMYEKLGDLLRANQYYKKAFLLKPESTIVPNKIRDIESIKYQKTGYYYLRRN